MDLDGFKRIKHLTSVTPFALENGRYILIESEGKIEHPPVTDLV